jgi:hypothetical protein
VSKGRHTVALEICEDETMKQYLLSVCYPPYGTPPGPAALAKIRSDLNVLHQELIAAGGWVFAGGLHPGSSATVVRVQDGEILTTDGPFAEGKEYLGGICILRAPDLDAALQWAGKFAKATTVAIEVRPFQDQGHP